MSDSTNKGKTKAVTLSLTAREERDLTNLSKALFGRPNKSGLVRYWINKERASQEARKIRSRQQDTGLTSLNSYLTEF